MSLHFTFQLHQMLNKYFLISKDFWKNMIIIHKSSKIKKKLLQTRKIYKDAKSWSFLQKSSFLKFVISDIFLDWQINKDSMITMIKRNLVARICLCFEFRSFDFDEDHDSIAATWSVRSKICVSIGATMPMWSCVN